MNSESERIVNYTIKGRSKLDLATLARARMYHQDTDILSSHVIAEVVLASTQRKRTAKATGNLHVQASKTFTARYHLLLLIVDEAADKLNAFKVRLAVLVSVAGTTSVHDREAFANILKVIVTDIIA